MSLNRLTIIYGKTGTGKTLLSKSLIKDEKRVIVIDMLDEYSDESFIVVKDFDSFYEIVTNQKEFKISCQYSNDLDIETTFQLVRKIKNLVLVVEEASIYISPNTRQSYFLDLCRFGRHENIKIIGISRRASELSADFKGLSECIISLRQTEPLDLSILSKLGLNNLSDLTPYEYKPNYPPQENIHYVKKIL